MLDILLRNLTLREVTCVRKDGKLHTHFDIPHAIHIHVEEPLYTTKGINAVTKGRMSMSGAVIEAVDAEEQGFYLCIKGASLRITDVQSYNVRSYMSPGYIRQGIEYLFQHRAAFLVHPDNIKSGIQLVSNGDLRDELLEYAETKWRESHERFFEYQQSNRILNRRGYKKLLATELSKIMACTVGVSETVVGAHLDTEKKITAWEGSGLPEDRVRVIHLPPKKGAYHVEFLNARH